jgi:hypothetical protein
VNAAAEQTTQPAAAQPANPVHDEGAQPALIEPSVDQNSGTGPGQIPKFAQPVLPLQSDLPVQLDQPVQPDQPVPSAQPAEVAEPESGLDALFGTQDTDTDTTDINTTDTTTNTNTTTNNSSNNAALAEPGAADQLPPAGATVPSPVAQWGLTPSGRRAEGERRADARPQVEDSSTPWFWLVVVSPLIAAVLIGLVSAPSGGKPTGWMVALALVVPYLLVLLFAVADKSRLVALGFEEPVPWAWAAATAPVYLIMRAGAVRRESGSGGPGLIVWLVCFVLAILAILGYGLLTHNPLIPGLPG